MKLFIANLRAQQQVGGSKFFSFQLSFCSGLLSAYWAFSALSQPYFLQHTYKKDRFSVTGVGIAYTMVPKEYFICFRFLLPSFILFFVLAHKNGSGCNLGKQGVWRAFFLNCFSFLLYILWRLQLCSLCVYIPACRFVKWALFVGW